jgi:hypothetical protein
MRSLNAIKAEAARFDLKCTLKTPKEADAARFDLKCTAEWRGLQLT